MDKLKKKKDEQDQVHLQSVLNEFCQSFEDGGRQMSKTFIKTDVVNASKSAVAEPTLYKPKPIQLTAITPSIQDAKRKAIEIAKKFTQEGSSSATKLPVNRPPKLGIKKVVQQTKMSNLEIFKEELKQTQALRQERKGLRQQLVEKLGPNSEAIDRIAPALDNPYLNSGTAEFDDDPSTTNLYVSNMPLDITMEELYDTFGSFGPLASAKILYPRPDEERRREHLCGFIAFMSRIDAERAWCAMSGERMKGSELRVSWARPVALPPVPFYVPIPLRELAMPDPPSGLPFNAKPLSTHLREFLKKYQNLPALNAPLPNDYPELVEDYKKMIENSVIRVVTPTERPLLMLIHRVIEFLVREGPVFEAIIMARERLNPMYRFLFENHHPTHVYYRWKLYSILQGEDRQNWRLERFRMFEGGSWWEPPPHSLYDHGMPPQLYHTSYVPSRRGITRYESRAAAVQPQKRVRISSENSDEEGKNENESESKKLRGVLDEKERNELENILRNIVPEKLSIGDAMVWCVEHSESAKEIVQCIYESLCIKETPLHKKIARIYLTSDILANCGARVRDVFYFRQYFGEVMLKIFVELNETLETIQSRIKAEQFRSRIMLCFRMWEDNSIYPTDVLINLQNVFLGLAKPTFVDGDSDTGEDLDGEPIAEDLDGVPIEDIDGEPLVYDMEQGYSESQSKADNDSKMLFKTTSWSQVDTEAEPVFSIREIGSCSKWDSNDLNRNSPDIDYRDEQSSSPNSQTPLKRDTNERIEENKLKSNNKEYEDERRKLLRDIEVKIMKFQDELECTHCKNIDEEIAKYRKKQMDRMDEKLEKILSKKKTSKDRKSDKNSPHKNERRDSRDQKKSVDSRIERSTNGKDKDSDRKRSNSSRRYGDESSTRHSTTNNSRDDKDRDRRRDRTPERRRH